MVLGQEWLSLAVGAYRPNSTSASASASEPGNQAATQASARSRYGSMMSGRPLSSTATTGSPEFRAARSAGTSGVLSARSRSDTSPIPSAYGGSLNTTTT